MTTTHKYTYIHPPTHPHTHIHTHTHTHTHFALIARQKDVERMISAALGHSCGSSVCIVSQESPHSHSKFFYKVLWYDGVQ